MAKSSETAVQEGNIMLQAQRSAQDNRDDFEPLLTLREAAILLGMHWKTLETMARKEIVPAFRIGGRWRFRTSLLNKWLQKRLVSGVGSELQ